MADASAEPSAAQGIPWAEVFRKAPGSALLATGLGSGLLPKAPGTWGSLLAVLLAFSHLVSRSFDSALTASDAGVLIAEPLDQRA